MQSTSRHRAHGLRRRGLLLLAGMIPALACEAGSSPSQEPALPALAEGLEPARRDSLLRRNLDPQVSLPPELLQEHMQAWRHEPVGTRIALWADLFRQRGDATYRFGLQEGGYVAEGLLVQDHRFDCVLFFYRCTELALAGTPRDAVLHALDRRFAGAPTAPVDARGRVDYEDPAHLDYSLDIVRSGLWGRNVTVEVGDAVPDEAGTSRYPPGSFDYIPSRRLRLQNLRDGDHVFFVLDESSERGRRLRTEYGLVVGHQGIVRRRGDTVMVLHAASKDLPGQYEGNRVVEVPLTVYLERVDNHKGILVTRFEENTGR